MSIDWWCPGTKIWVVRGSHGVGMLGSMKHHIKVFVELCLSFSSVLRRITPVGLIENWLKSQPEELLCVMIDHNLCVVVSK